MPALIPADLFVAKPFEAHALGSLIMLRGSGDWTGPACLALKVGGLDVGLSEAVDAALIIQGSPYREHDDYVGQLVRPNDGAPLQGEVLGIAKVRVAFDAAAPVEHSRQSAADSRAAIGLSASGPFIVGGTGHDWRGVVTAFSLQTWKATSQTAAYVWAADWSVVIDCPFSHPVSVPIKGYSPARYKDHPGLVGSQAR